MLFQGLFLLNCGFNCPKSWISHLLSSLECSQVILLKLLAVKPNINQMGFQHSVKLCLYPSRGWFPAMRALKRGQLKLLYFPHLTTRPSGDSDNTTEPIIRPSSKFNHLDFSQCGRGQTHYLTCASTHQNSFRHVLPKNKFCPTVCTVCGIFWTERKKKH